MNSYELFGPDTMEIITAGEGKGDYSFDERGGPEIWSGVFGLNPGKLLYLYPDHLKLLYDRFATANPSGLLEGWAGTFDDYLPPGMTKEERDRLEDEGELFVDIFPACEETDYPRARKYLPELFEPGVIEKMAADPWLDATLLGKAIREGAVPARLCDAARWSPEWRAYCDRLIASGAYK